MKTVSATLSAEGKKFTIVVGRFNNLITDRLLSGALDCLHRHGGDEKLVTVVYVPGAYEIPLAASLAAQRADCDAVIALGAVIRGSTPHFDYVASEAAKGVAAVSLKEQKPVIFGILTTDTIEQAVERAGTKSGNKGWDAALSAIEMAGVCNLLKM